MSLVNAPMQAFVMLRIPRDLRTQALAFSAVLNCVAAPVGLLIAGWALSQFSTRAVIAAVLAVQSVGRADDRRQRTRRALRAPGQASSTRSRESPLDMPSGPTV